MLIDGFNDACSNIVASYIKVRDESMSTIIFRTTSKGSLPHLSYIFRNPELLGTEFKTVARSVTVALVLLEIQRVKEGMKLRRYHLELGNTSSCTNILMEETKDLEQRDLKGSTRGCFLLDSWFSSKKSAEAAASLALI